MIDLILWVAGFCTGAAFTGCLAGWFSLRRAAFYREYLRRRRPAPGMRCIRLDEGRVQRGNGSGGPTTPKPAIIPKPQFPSPRVIREDLLP